MKKEIIEDDNIYYIFDYNSDENDGSSNINTESDNEVSESEVYEENEVSESEEKVDTGVQHIIYIIKNVTNNKVFIDSTTIFKKYEGNLIKWSADHEFEQHKKNLKRKSKENIHPLLYSDMKEYGVDNFIIEILTTCNEIDCLNNLNKYKKELKSEEEHYGYNIGKTTGIIYLITNNKNNKKYVGQTKSCKKIKNYIKPWTAQDRLNEHKKNCMMESKKMTSPKLYEAMNIFGVENFTVQTLLYCNIKDTGKYEKYFIKKYNTQHENFGYNIAPGSKVDHSINHPKRKTIMTDELRKKLSKTNNETTNITEIKYKEKIVGYRVRISIEGNNIEKRFSSQKNTLEENFNNAKEFLVKVKNKENIDDIRLNNKSNDLPLNIFLKKKKGNIIGYEFMITIDGKKHTKSFCSKKISMEDKLKMAINYKNNLLN